MNDRELRRIRDGVEVIAMCLVFIAIHITLFSGWAFDKPTGLAAAGAWAFNVFLPFWTAKSIRSQK